MYRFKGKTFFRLIFVVIVIITNKKNGKKNILYREKNQANTKKFIEERKNNGFKQNKVKYIHSIKIRYNSIHFTYIK